MKKIALLALTLILLLTTALPMTVAADESSAVEDASNVTEAIPTSTRVLDPNKLNVCLGSGAAKQGDLVEIPVTVETNPGVWGLTLEVHYDMNIMVLQNVKFSDAFKKDMACLDIDNVTVSSNQKNYDSPFTLYAEGNSLTSNVKTTGLFATLTFLVIPGCELGQTEISMTYKPNNVIDLDMNNVLAAMYGGTVHVSKGKDAEPGVTYFPSRTRKSTTAAKSGALSGTTLVLIIVGAVLIVVLVLAILVVRKPANATENATPAAPVKEAKPDVEKKETPASDEDDGIDDQA